MTGLTGVDIIGQGAGDYPPPLDGAYLLVLDDDGRLCVFEAGEGGWVDTMGDDYVPTFNPRRWWLMRVPVTP